MGSVRRTTLAFCLAAAVGCAGGSNNGGDSCEARLLAGDLVITEVFADPPGEDTGKEWFEIYNASRLSIDLTGVEVIASRPDGTGEKIHVIDGAQISSEGYLVLGGILPELKPDYVGYGYAADLGALRNSDGKLTLRCNDVIVDEFSYETLMESASKSYDGTLVPDSAGNDDLARWCDATTPFESGQFGTPGEANTVCTTVGNLETCLDGTTLRNVEKPGVGDLVITELMPNPAGVENDSDGEWFEIFVGRSVDLNGLQIGNVVVDGVPTVRFVIDDPNCRRVTAGSHVVLARNLMTDENGGLPASTDLQYGTASLSNTSGSLFVAMGGTVIDSISWSGSFDGASWSLDPGKRDATQNDDQMAWCRGVGDYSAANDGTPGAANPACPVVVPAGMCRDTGTNMPRPIVKAAAGDLVVTEIMANPIGGDTQNREWFEVLVKKNVDLNDLEFGKRVPTVATKISQTDCLPVTTNSRLVFIATLNTDGTDVPAAKVTRGLNFGGIANSGGTTDNRGVFMSYDAGTVVVDATTFTRISPTDGKSWQLSNDSETSVLNDELPDPTPITNWCYSAATAFYPPADPAPMPENRNLGTPGDANIDCTP
jgi:hypothetical protein